MKKKIMVIVDIDDNSTKEDIEKIMRFVMTTITNIEGNLMVKEGLRTISVERLKKF